MKRYGTVINVRPEKLGEYKKLHSAVWSEVLELLKKYNIRNISIYYKDGFLFEYFEYTGTDFEGDMAEMSAVPVYKKWLALCDACQEPLETRAENEWWAKMEEVFHCD